MTAHLLTPRSSIKSSTMTSHADAAADTSSKSSEQAIIAAARTEFEQYGVRRTNIDDIARRAGISRSTLYRRFPTKDALFEHLVLIDTKQLFDELDRVAAGRDAQSALVECFTVGMATIQRMPLFGGILRSEPEMLFGMTNRTKGLPVLLASQMVAGSLRRSGVTMSDEDLEAVSEILIRLTASVLMNPNGQLDITDPDAVRRYANRYLARLVW